jgi:hypothetical protein
MDVTQLDNEQVQGFLKEMVRLIVGDKPVLTPQEAENLNQNFNKCVDNLSELDPVIAFLLNGKNNVHNLLKEIVMRSNELAKAKFDIKDIDQLPNLLSKIEPNVITKAISDIEEILIVLAEKAGKSTVNQVKKRLMSKRSETEIAEMEKFIDTMLAGIIPQK